MASKLKTDILETVSGSGTIALTNQLSGMTTASLPSGSVLQVQSGILTSTYSQTASAYTDIGLSVTITPSSTSSKILVSLSVALGMTQTGVNVRLRLVRGSTMIGSSTDLSDSGFSHREQNTSGNQYTRMLESFTYLDSPSSTSAQTYKVQMFRSNTAGTSYINKGSVDQSRQHSHITVQEIKG